MFGNLHKSVSVIDVKYALKIHFPKPLTNDVEGQQTDEKNNSYSTHFSLVLNIIVFIMGVHI